MRRLYFLVPDAGSAEAIVNDLLLARIDARHLHVLAKDRHMLRERDLPETGFWQDTDFKAAIEKGLAAGGGVGFLAGLAAFAIPGLGIAFGGAAMLGSTLAGAGLGSWFASMIGISAPNSELQRFQDAIERGELLIMVDVHRDKVEEVTALVHSRHQEAEVQGTEPTMPPFP